MKDNKDIKREIIRTKNRVNFLHIPEIVQQMKFWGIDKSVIDKELLKKDRAIIELYFDRSKSWLAIKGGSFIGLTILLINTWWSIWLSPLFIITFVFSLFSTTFANRNYNIIFNTLLKKIEDEKRN